MVLLQLMGGAFTDQESPVPFPYRLYEKVEKRKDESKLVFIRDSMKQIYDLYRHGNHSSTTWDPIRTTKFLESVNRQIKELSSCVSINKHTTSSQLSRYYKRLKNCTLSRTGGSAASWELLRKETKHHLDMLDLLGNSL
ncbi:interferon phi 1 isoform X2 [Melanotaenia boesemani]|nr:interferon phi 1 isoform X2 [Melanotaenia boesemani]